MLRPNGVAQVNAFDDIFFFLHNFILLRYNGTSNDYDEVTKWIDFELLDEQNANAFSELPQEPEAHTGCKVLSSFDSQLEFC